MHVYKKKLINNFYVLGICLSALFCGSVIAGIFDYDIASYYGQSGNWAQAKYKLKCALVDRQGDPNVLYDLGVAYFETKDFVQAAECFKRVVENKNASSRLKEQANFNLGNTNVELKNLYCAIKNYEQALKINHENKFAKHNLDIVRKMLAQEKNKQQDRQNGKNKEQDKEKEHGLENEKLGEKENKQQDGNKSKSEDGSKKDQQNQRGQGKNGANESDNKQWKEFEFGSKDFEKGHERSEKRGDKKQGQSRNDHRDQEKPVGDKIQNINHDKNNKVETRKNQEQAGNGKVQNFAKDNKPMSMELLLVDGAKKLDEGTKKILQEVEEFDKKSSKEFMKAAIEKNMSGKYGQNLW